MISHSQNTSAQPSGKPGLKAFGKVALHFLRAGLGFGMAAGFWWLAQGELTLFALYAAICAFGSLIPLVTGLWALVQFLLQRRKWARYEALGAAPKADPMAGTDALRDRGLLK